jgi:hypothetical protein
MKIVIINFVSGHIWNSCDFGKIQYFLVFQNIRILVENWSTPKKKKNKTKTNAYVNLNIVVFLTYSIY